MSCVMDQKKPMLIAILYVSERHLTDKKYVGGNFMGQMFVEGKARKEHNCDPEMRRV